LEQLEILVEVANCKSMSIASEKLHITVQSISKSLLLLEEEFHVPLLVRTKHGVFLTADGEFVYNKSINILNDINCLKEAYCSFNKLLQTDIQGKLSILVSFPLSESVMNLEKTLSTKYPSLISSIIIKESVDINQQLLKYDEELVPYEIVLTDMGQRDVYLYKELSGQYDIYFLYKDRLGLEVPINDPLAREKTVSLKTIAKLPLVSLTHNKKPAQHFRLLQEFGVALTPKFTSNLPNIISEYVTTGRAYGLKRMSEQGANENTVIIPLHEKAYIFNLMFVIKKRSLSPQGHEFVHLCLKNYASTYNKIY
jgi:Transcriptional regulator